MLAPLAALADINCLDPENIDKEECSADILIVTTMEKSDESPSYKALVKTLNDNIIKANNLKVPKEGITDDKIDLALYSNVNGKKIGRYKVLVFPNGRVSYDQNDVQNSISTWQSAITFNQWEGFYDYSRENDARLVFLNEYPSNYTGTQLYYDINPQESQEEIDKKLLGKQVIVPAPDIYEENAIKEAQINTEHIWHFPAKENQTPGITIEPLLYFDASPPEYPEKTLAAVLVKNEKNGKEANYAAFFLPFGDWNEGSTALNVIWLSWALQKDFKYISGKQISAEEAIKQSGASQTSKLELIFVALCTIFTITVTLF